MRGEKKALFFLILFCGGGLIVGGWGVVGWGRKSYLGLAEIGSFSSRNFSRSNKHDTLLTCCIYWIFLRFIFMSHCCFKFSSLGNLYKLRPSLVTLIITVNSHANNHFINFFIKIHIKVFLYLNLIWMWSTALIFSNKNHDLQKKKN